MLFFSYFPISVREEASNSLFLSACADKVLSPRILSYFAKHNRFGSSLPFVHLLATRDVSILVCSARPNVSFHCTCFNFLFFFRIPFSRLLSRSCGFQFLPTVQLLPSQRLRSSTRGAKLASETDRYVSCSNRAQRSRVYFLRACVRVSSASRQRNFLELDERVPCRATRWNGDHWKRRTLPTRTLWDASRGIGEIVHGKPSRTPKHGVSPQTGSYDCMGVFRVTPQTC